MFKIEIYKNSWPPVLFCKLYFLKTPPLRVRTVSFYYPRRVLHKHFLITVYSHYSTRPKMWSPVVCRLTEKLWLVAVLFTFWVWESICFLTAVQELANFKHCGVILHSLTFTLGNVLFTNNSRYCVNNSRGIHVVWTVNEYKCLCNWWFLSVPGCSKLTALVHCTSFPRSQLSSRCPSPW